MESDLEGGREPFFAAEFTRLGAVDPARVGVLEALATVGSFEGSSILID